MVHTKWLRRRVNARRRVFLDGFAGEKFDRFLINSPQYDITSYCFF